MSDWNQRPAEWEDAPFEAAEFAENPEPRCPCALLLDTSTSMSGEKIRQLNEGLDAFRSSLMQDEMAMKRVEIATVTFGSTVSAVSDFVAPDALHWPRLEASGNTPMGGAILKGIEMVAERKRIYISNGVSYYRPWLFLITDGEPTDNDRWERAIEEIHRGEEMKHFMFFPVGVEGANFDKMTRMTARQPLKLRNLEFGSLFQWLSNSLTAVAHSQTSERVSLPPPGWAETT